MLHSDWSVSHPGQDSLPRQEDIRQLGEKRGGEEEEDAGRVLGNTAAAGEILSSDWSIRIDS